MNTVRIQINETSANGFLQLVGRSIEDIQEQIKTKKLVSENLKSCALKKALLRKMAIDRKLKLKKKLLDEKLQLEMLTEANKKYNLELIEVQKDYNDVVDPFNNHGTGIKNKENVYKMTKLLSEINKEAQNQIIQHRQTVESMTEEEKSIEEKIAEEKQYLESQTREVECKQKMLSEVREKCHTASLKKSSIDFDGLIQLTDSSSAALEQKKLDINEIRANMVQTEDAIAKLNEEIKQRHEELNLLQNEISEVAAANLIKEKQELHEKNMFEDHLDSMCEVQSDRIVNGNMNLAREIAAILNIQDENKNIEEDLIKELNMNVENEHFLTEESVKIASAIEKLEEEMETISDSRILMEQHEKLTKSIEEMRKEKQAMIEEHEISKEICKGKIQKEEQRQAVLGVVDEDKSGSASSDEMKSLGSMSSSFMSESNVKAERIDFNLSVVNTSSEQSSKKDKKRKSN